uniref:Uncharacterized protein n=1 Tax=Pyrodinium bahamense TaxID=73915 RepID=A0A7S0AAC9_9DINO
MVVPAFKLLLLCVGEIWRSSTDPSKVRGARLCIYTVQLVSKWACPDMFAYILLLYLLRSLGGDLVGSQVHLDMGFMHFSVFCICSTFSSLAIRLPARPPPEGSCRQSPQQAQQHRRRREEKALVAQLRFWLVAGLALLFLLCLGAGICTSCMSLRVDTSLLVKPTGPLPSWVQPVLTWLDVASQTASDVKLWQCVVSLCWWSLDEANCFLALLLLAVFALALPAANMVLLLCVSAGEVVSAVGSPPQPGHRKGYVSCASSAVHVLKHLSMLDVAITGIVVACLVTGVYKEQGIVLSMGPGLAYLVLAEAIHYATYHLVQCSVTTAPEEVAQPAATSEP